MSDFNVNYQIGDRVRVHDYEGLPEHMKKAAMKAAGKEGHIIDVLWSYSNNCTIYKIQLDGYDRPSKVNFTEVSFDLIEEEEQAAKTYTYEFDYLDTVVTARLYEVDGDTKTQIAIGHGHIIHDGALGIAQAASYALKIIWLLLEDEEA
jgi:hypothetical protein